MKSRMSSFLAVAVVLSMLLTMVSVPPVLAVEPYPTDGPAPAATAAGELERATEPAIYLIRLSDPPLTSYQGGIAGLEATSASARGERKLDANSPASLAYRDYLAAQQDRFITSMEQTLGRSVDVVYHYAIANNGLAVWLSPDEAATVARMPGVVFMQRDFQRELQTDASVAYIGAPGIWDGSEVPGGVGSMGEGMIVGVIDTGITWLNPSFAEVGPVDGYPHVNPFPTYRGNCEPGSPNYQDICNDKLVGAYGYAGNGYDARDYNGHGSHTSSIAAGNVVDITDPVVERIQGVAPHANIISYASCCAGSDLSASIDDAILDGVDAINYSIGSPSPSDVWNDFDTVGYLNAREAGIFVATSAGNEGPDPDTVGSPADAPWLTAVGNHNHTRIYANLGDVTGPVPVPPELEDIPIVSGADSPEITVPIENDIVWAGDVAPGNELGCDPFPAGAFDDAIALILRGDCTFATKEQNAADAGAIAMVVFNHSAGPPIVMGGAGSIITSVMMAQSNGLAVVDWIQTHTGPTFRMNPGLAKGVNTAWPNIIAAGSSRGANRALPDIVKPDVASFGSDVLAAYATYDTVAWNFLSGTSMASPHVAGAATLLMAVHPDWTPAEVQSALMTTAWNDMLKEDGLTPADAFDIGGGRIQLPPAAQAGLVLDESIANYWAADPALGGDPKTLNLASAGNGSCVSSCSWERTVKSTLSTTQDWEVSTTSDPDISLVASPASFSLDPGETQTIVFTADVSSAALDAWYFGEVLISTPARDVPAAHLPVAVRPGSSTLPDLVEIVTDQLAGTQTVADIKVLDEITDLRTDSYGLVRADRTEDYLFQDPTNGDPYDNLDDVLWFTTDVPVGALRLVAEVIVSESPDLDMFVGTGDTPSAATEVCVSAGGSWNEYCNVNDPAAGTWWILVQNWDGSGDQPDRVVVTSAAVDDVDNGNMTVTGPTSVPAGTLFDLDVNWNEPSMVPQDRWYGTFALGNTPGPAGSIGYVNVNLEFLGPEITKTGPDTASTGEVISYTITIETPSPISGMAVMTDALPAGVDYADNLTYDYGMAWYDAGDNAVYWTNVMPPEATAERVAARQTVSIGDGPFSFSSSPASEAGPAPAPQLPSVPEDVVMLTHSLDQSIVYLNSVACWDGVTGHTDNSYLRKFTLADFGIVSELAVTNVQIGIEAAYGAGGDQPATMNLYVWDPATAFAWANFSLIGTANTVVPDQALTIIDVPVAGVAPAGSTLVVEFFTPDGDAEGNLMFVGSNPNGQTDSTYLAAADCGVPQPTPTENIGFPDMHLVMNVYGEATVPPDTVTVTFDVTVTTECDEVVNTAVLDYNRTIVSDDTSFTVPCCEPVTDVALSVLNTVPIYPGDDVEFSADIMPDGFTPPYSYTLNFGDATTPATGSDSVDPFTTTYAYDTPGTYEAEIEVWNCDMTEPVTDTVEVVVMETPCAPVTDVALSVLNTDPIYAGDDVEFSADIMPDGFTPPYSYTLDFGDLTPPATGSDSADPFTTTYAYMTPGTYMAEIEVWNCDMTEPVTDTVEVVVMEEPEEFLYFYLPLIVKNY